MLKVILFSRTHVLVTNIGIVRGRFLWIRRFIRAAGVASVGLAEITQWLRLLSTGAKLRWVPVPCPRGIDISLLIRQGKLQRTLHRTISLHILCGCRRRGNILFRWRPPDPPGGTQLDVQVGVTPSIAGVSTCHTSSRMSLAL